jgi:hypothetical protein
MERNVKVTITRVRRCRIQTDVLRARCAACQRQVEVISTAQAIEVLQVSAPAINRLLAAGVVHPIPTVSGHLWVCKDSLFAT